jgi:hypothetical protein
MTGPAGLPSLEDMLRVMRDPDADPQLRDEMAVAAAPYVHTEPAVITRKTVSIALRAGKTASRRKR